MGHRTDIVEGNCVFCGGKLRILHDEDGYWKKNEKEIIICTDCGEQQ